MAPKTRLFFSHSTDEGSDERKILTDIADALEALEERERYAVLLDRKTLELGGDWRATINFWIETCNAAVVLITKQSIASEFCQYEWSLLTYRQKRQPKFLIIPIYCGTTPDDIKNKPHQLAAVTGKKVEYRDTPSVVRQVSELLAALPALDQPGRWQVAFMAELFRRAISDANTVELAANRVDLDLGSWDLSVDRWHFFAVKLMGIGLLRATPVLLDLQQFFSGERQANLRDIVDLIGLCSWVDAGSAQRIREHAKREIESFGAIGLNAKESRTAKCYVLSGSERTPAQNWATGFALNVIGTSYEDLQYRVESALREALRLPGNADTAQIKKRLDTHRLAKQPVFVVLEAEGLDSRRLEKLCGSETFAWVTFLVLTGDAGARGLLRDEDLLMPPLSSEFEDKIWRTYDDITESFSFQ